MNGLLQRLLGSPSLRLGQPGVELGFEHPIPAWAWALVALGAVGLGFLAYRRTEGARAGRIALGALRAALLLLLAVLIAGPRLIRPNETEEKDWVLVLVDRSASLSVADAPPAPGSAEGAKHPTREAQLRAVLKAAEPTFRALAAERAVVWLGFDAGAYDLPLPQGAAVPDLTDPAGRRTDLDRALDAALRRAAARPVSGVVLLTDGRSVSEPSRTILRRLEAEKVPVFSVPLGSPTGLPDVALRRVDAPRYAFVKDAVPVVAELSRSGPAPAGPEPSVVELIDLATGAVLDTQTVQWDNVAPPAPGAAPGAPGAGADAPQESTQRVTLTTRPTAGGQARWRVRVRPGPGSPGDMVEDNNAAEAAVELVDRPLRVAYFEGYPRWEYRYLKNLLVREASASAVVMLLAPSRRYIQEGNVVLDSPPRTPEEWSKFDVIILGDVQPGVFTTEQLEGLKQRVAVGGAGLIWIGGESATPGAWRAGPLADLLPMTAPEDSLAAMASGVESVGGPVTLAATPAADRLGVLRLSDTPTPATIPGAPPSYFPANLTNPATGWSRLFWAQKIDPATVKPTAEVLATAVPVGPAGESDTAHARPVLLSMRYGAGRVIYLGTDEIWRWRYGRGELLPERFWIQLVRLLGRESVARTGRPAILEVTPDRASIEQPVRVQVTLIDQSLVDTAPTSLRVRVTREGAPAETADAPTELALTPESPAAASPAKGPGAGRVYAGTWVPAEAGRYRVAANDPALLGTASADDLSVKVEVWQPDDEMRRPQTDHPLLAKLSDLTGGRTLAQGDLAQLPRLLPNRRLKLAGEPDVHTLWDTPLALLLVVLLLSCEWIGRRLLRLA